jgi:iron complex outermembrane receptor protein
VALYGQATYTVAEKMDITLGIRYDYEHQQQHVSATYQRDPDPAFITTFPDSSAKASFNAFSPKLSLNYHLSGNSMTYVTYSRGFRAGGLTPLSSDPSQPPLFPYQPEYSNNYEAGIKNDLFNKSMRLNLYAFYSNITNAQVPTLVLPEAVTITKNTGKLVSKGLEAEILTQPLQGLELGYNFGYTHAKFSSLKIAQNGTFIDLAGKHQIFTPDITSMLSAQYSYPLGGRQQLKAVLRAEWKYLGTTYYDLANSISQSPYSLLNLRAGIAAKNFEIMFWDRNATDTRYIAYAYDFGAVRLGDPKTYGVTLMVQL